MDRAAVLGALKHVYDPDKPDQTVVELGIVESSGVEITDQGITVTYCLRSPVCPYSAAIGVLIHRGIEKMLKVSPTVRIDPKHYQAEVVNQILSDEAKTNELAGKMEASGIFRQCLR